MATIPPPPDQPPTAGTPHPDSEPVAEWWRKGGPRIPAPSPGLPDTVYTPVPVGAGAGGPVSMEAAAEAFWAPAGRLFAEQATTIASQVGQQVGEQVTQLLTETQAQREARQQVEYETRLASERTRMDAAFEKVGETQAEQARRHGIEDILVPGPPQHTDLLSLIDRLADRITETPEEKAARLETEHELHKQRARIREDHVRAAAGETPKQRDLRHRQQHLADQREAKQRARRQRRRAARAQLSASTRYRRFRRWCTLTAISAVGGYSIGLVTVITPGGPWVGAILATFGHAFDLYLRDRGRLRVTEVRGAGRLALLTVVRIPVASGLVVATGLGGLLPALHLYR
ncbi:hypothetical protein ACGF0D_10650 [Kitasatospora sp. NPDC048298]|uniref:hypothetical protein n=1 Tax=Kitasatospora sp. NPDC048298 TaxID=3364049 RepID=UPI0037196A34